MVTYLPATVAHCFMCEFMSAPRLEESEAVDAVRRHMNREHYLVIRAYQIRLSQTEIGVQDGD